MPHKAEDKSPNDRGCDDHDIIEWLMQSGHTIKLPHLGDLQARKKGYEQAQGQQRGTPIACQIVTARPESTGRLDEDHEDQAHPDHGVSQSQLGIGLVAGSNQEVGGCC